MSASAALVPASQPLRICVVADGRSPITRAWLGHLANAGHEIHLISTFACSGGGLDVHSTAVSPVALARFASAAPASGLAHAPRHSTLGRLRRALVATLTPAVYGWIAPFDVRRHVQRTRALVLAIRPDVVHAMRIQYEGVLATEALDGLSYPMVLSIWGNDLEFWAARYRLIGRLARRVLQRASALIPDCERDLLLARDWGWNASKPAEVLPTNGGIDTSLFHPGEADRALAARFNLPSHAPIVLNARGFRAYVRNDTFFRAIPRILAKHPNALFVCTGMLGDPRAERWVRELGIERATRLLPRLSRAEMAALVRTSDVAVSPSLHDGTPNTLLEAMACGAFPVAGDITSVREWIDHGANGLLCDPTDVESLAGAVSRALSDDALRHRAAAINDAIVVERADANVVMARAERLYQQTAALAGPR